MAKRALAEHPDTSTPGLSVGCKVSRFGPDALKLEYVVIGQIARICLPAIALPDRVDGLWATTCMEIFFGKSDGSYVEFNLAPSRRWAGYRFEGYRIGMTPALDLLAPDIFVEQNERRFALTAYVELPSGELDSVAVIALSAVIEETGGHKSYWALAHPPGQPDFHHPTCFAATLPAPSEP